MASKNYSDSDKKNQKNSNEKNDCKDEHCTFEKNLP
jgi:hypothetical protein